MPNLDLDLSALLALGAAVSWTMAALTGHRPATELGSLHFNRLRMLAAIVMLGLFMIISGRPIAIDGHHMVPLALSAIMGIVMGDFFLFATMRRLGPRRTNVLFSTNAPIAAFLGWLILGEVLRFQTVVSVLFGFLGVVLAIIYGKRRDLTHVWEHVVPPLWLGVVFGLLAAIGQAFGVLLVRPVMAQGVDPVMASLVRVTLAAVVFWASYPFDKTRRLMPIFPRGWTLALVGLNGFFGLGLGAALFLAALEFGSVAKVTILSATTPVLMLVFVWARTGAIPATGAWIGAILVVACSAVLIF
jgi:drug/metabolite transporter (DMT)-like permease